MNWDAIGAVGEIVAAVAVVISIIYLSIQIRSNTKTERARAGFDASSSWSNHNEYVAQLPDRFLESFAKVSRDVPDLEDISPVELTKLGIYQRSVFQKAESHFHLSNYGLMESNFWELRRTWCRTVLEAPFWRAWWENEKPQSIYSAEFIENIDSAKPLSIGAYDWFKDLNHPSTNKDENDFADT